MAKKATAAMAKRCDILREMLLEESDAQDDADNRVHDDQQWLGHSKRANVQRSLDEQRSDESTYSHGVDGPARQHATSPY